MRTVAIMVFIAACGGESPMLGGVPHPNNGAMAGGAAAAAAALTLADPHAADRKPETPVEEEKKPVDVKEQVPASALDHLDGAGSGSAVVAKKVAPAPAPAAGSGSAAPKKVVIPSPHDAVDPNHPDSINQ